MILAGTLRLSVGNERRTAGRFNELIAGVSIAAVSKVLRDAYGVSESLRARVQASMATLGYRPHAAARGMRGQTYTLGILLNDIRNPFYPDILDGVNTALSRTQYQALIGMGQAMAPIETALVDAMVDRQMDGIIMIGPAHVSAGGGNCGGLHPDGCHRSPRTRRQCLRYRQ